MKTLSRNALIFSVASDLLFLSGCSPGSGKEPVDFIYRSYYPAPGELHWGAFFFPFQSYFLSIILFLTLFILFQYSQNRRRDYFFYGIYLIVSWLYFLRSFPVYFYSLMENADSYEQINNFLRPAGGGGASDRTEFIFFVLLTVSYLFFVNAFFNFQEAAPGAYRLIRVVSLVLGAGAVLQLLVLCLVHTGKNYFWGPSLDILKQGFFLPAVWLMWQLSRFRPPGWTYIVTGTSVLLLASLIIVLLRLSGDPLTGKRVYLQVGVLAEVLFFSAALGRKDKALRLRLNEMEEMKKEAERKKANLEQENHKLKLNRKEWTRKFRRLRRQLTVRTRPPARKEESFAEKLEQIMSVHFHDPRFKVQELTNLMDLEPRTLYRRIKLLYGVSTETYMLNYRIEKARQLLADPVRRLQDISDQAGFDRYDYFSRAFKERVGVSPKEYRANLRGRDGAGQV